MLVNLSDELRRIPVFNRQVEAVVIALPDALGKLQQIFMASNFGLEDRVRVLPPPGLTGSRERSKRLV